MAHPVASYLALCFTREKYKIRRASDPMDYRGSREQSEYSYPAGYAPEMPAAYGGKYIPDTRITGFQDNRAGTVFINPKQIYWIRKRQMRREILDSVMIQQRNNYMHESRHRHAMKRMRAPSGRFLTKEETAEARRLETNQEE